MPNTQAYGLGRMYEILGELGGEKGIRVVGSLDEAAWLGVVQMRSQLTPEPLLSSVACCSARHEPLR